VGLRLAVPLERPYVREVSFDVTADAYGRFMGQYSEPLAAEFVTLVDPRSGQRALDVGCGPGALTAALVERLGAAAVTAVDPSESFVSAARSRLPEVDVHKAKAEALPFPDDTFDLTLAQLVVHFMAEPEVGIAELARVTKPGGLVSACVWDHAGGLGPLATFWQAVHDLDPGAPDESGLPGAHDGHLVELFELAGLDQVEQTTLTVRVRFATVAQWWDPFTLGVGPAGAYVRSLDPEQRDRLEARCTELLPTGAFDVEAMAWTALGRA
jgi:SAM-dependent methyltransferase